MKPLPSVRCLNGHYIAMQAGFWAMFAAIVAYQAALLQSRGFTSGETGALFAARCLAGIISQPLLGGFADRHPKVRLKVIVVLSLLLSLGAAAVFLAVPMDFGGTLVILILLGGFEISAYPLMDAMAIQFINAGVPIRYSLGRGLGSMAYAVVCVLLGVQVGRTGVESTLVTHLVLLAVEILLVASFPAFRVEEPAAEASVEKPHSVLFLLRRSPAFTLMLLAILLGMTGVLPLSNFLVNILQSRGGDSSQLGLALFLMGGAELPTAFFFHKLLRRLGSGKVLLISMVFCTLKGVAFYFAAGMTGVLAAQPLQMLGYGLFTPASVYFVNESVPPADRVRGQTMMMVASNGMGGVLGNAMAGVALDAGGANLLLLCCIALGVLSVLLALFSLAVCRKTSEGVS